MGPERAGPHNLCTLPCRWLHICKVESHPENPGLRAAGPHLYSTDTSRVGTRATLRVMLMRFHCEMFRFRKPLMTNCPVYTPVIVLLWPAQAETRSPHSSEAFIVNLSIRHFQDRVLEFHLRG